MGHRRDGRRRLKSAYIRGIAAFALAMWALPLWVWPVLHGLSYFYFTWYDAAWFLSFSVLMFVEMAWAFRN